MMSTSTSPSSANSHLWAEKYQLAEEVHSLMNFKTGYDNFMHANASSLLSFDQNDKHCNYGLIEDFNCCDTSSDYGFMITSIPTENQGDWLYTEATVVTDNVLDSRPQDSGRVKRPHPGESTQALKKQCTSTTTTQKPKPKTVPYSKDPQTIAAKNRRERISERLKILQELVPNGSKVDLVTMLEKAIGYVKFLQLQVKVLATDEFWPAPGGKAPNISQVREAIDAILSSQRDKNSK